VRTRVLFHDRFIGVVRMGHALCQGEITPARYASGQHVLVTRRGREQGLMDDVLRPLGLQREMGTFVGGFSAALAFARATDLIATVPERHTGQLRDGLYSFPLPAPLPEIAVSMLWHPRMDGDTAHHWLRSCLQDICTAKA
jgi:DNA-binding transcriptional LysR family regulator